MPGLRVSGASDAVLQVHHVDQDRTNNAETNLLTVCAPCHLAYHGRGELLEDMRAAHAALRYHGVLAANAKLRSRIVPAPTEADRPAQLDLFNTTPATSTAPSTD